jgi:hypothetical protein
VPAFVPLVIARRRFLRVATFLGVPADARGKRLTPEAEQAALDRIVDHLRRNRIADRISQPANWCLFRAAPQGAQTAHFGTYILDLQQSPEALWAGIHPKHRNMIRGGEKAGVRVLAGPDRVEDFHRLYLATMARNAMAAEPLAFFQALAAAPGLAVHCAVAYDGDVPLGAVFVPYSGHGGFYVHGATADVMTIKGANTFLHHHTLLALRDKGAACYDMVGARLSDVSGTRLAGIQTFKARFGGPLHEGLLWKIDLNKPRCLAYDGLLAARMRLRGQTPTRDIIDQENRKR